MNLQYCLEQNIKKLRLLVALSIIKI